MADLNQSKNSNPLKTILDSSGNNVLLSNGISSLNFDGLIPKSSSLKVVSDIKVGDVVSDAEFSQAGNSYLITRVLSQDLMTSNITTTLYFLYYLSDTDGEKQLTYSSDYLDSYEDTEYYGGYDALKQLYVLSDDIDNINLGTNGWFISNAGNAVFSNGFFRGRIEATEGIFSGKVFAGDRNASVVIGKDLFDGGEFRDSDTYVTATPTGVVSVPSGTQTHGLLMDNNNYFFTFSGQTPTNITSVVVSNTTKTDYEYYATFTYTTPSFTFDVNNRIDRYSNIDISGIVDSPDTNTDLGTLNRSFTPTNITIDGTVSRSGTTATINCTAHGLSAGNTVEISGFVGDNYSVNGFWTVSATGLTANAFQVTTTETGTINATRSSKTVTFATGNTTTATTSTAHGLSNGDSIQFTTSGTLPTGLSTGVTYYIINRTDLTFIVSDTYNGNSVITTSAGSGTHTVNVLNIDQSAALTKAGTFTVKLPSELTQYISTYPTTVSLPSGSSANNLVLPETLALTSVVLSRKTITTNISSVNAYIPDASLYVVDERITLANFGTSGSTDLTALNNTFAITAINTGADYLTFTTNRITAGTYTFSSNYPYISQIGQISKFKVGGANNFMKYDSSTDALTVTGSINATSGSFKDITINPISTNLLSTYDADFSTLISSKNPNNTYDFSVTSTSANGAYGMAIQSIASGRITSYQSAIVTAASGNGTTITYTASNSFSPGQIVTITDLIATTGSSLNLSGVIVATSSSTQFTVTNSTVGTAVATQTGTVTVDYGSPSGITNGSLVMSVYPFTNPSIPPIINPAISEPKFIFCKLNGIFTDILSRYSNYDRWKWNDFSITSSGSYNFSVYVKPITISSSGASSITQGTQATITIRKATGRYGGGVSSPGSSTTGVVVASTTATINSNGFTRIDLPFTSPSDIATYPYLEIEIKTNAAWTETGYSVWRDLLVINGIQLTSGSAVSPFDISTNLYFNNNSLTTDVLRLQDSINNKLLFAISSRGDIYSENSISTKSINASSIITGYLSAGTLYVNSGSGILRATAGIALTPDNGSVSFNPSTGNTIANSTLTINSTSTNAFLVQSATGVNLINGSTSTTKYVQIAGSTRTTEELSVLGKIYASGTIVQNSSRQYKKDIKLFNVPESILEINPVTFVYDETKTEIADTDIGITHFGAIAEDFVDRGISEVVAFGLDGKIDGIEYNKIAVLLIPLIKQQKDRIEDLEKRIALLEDK